MAPMSADSENTTDIHSPALPKYDLQTSENSTKMPPFSVDKKIKNAKVTITLPKMYNDIKNVNSFKILNLQLTARICLGSPEGRLQEPAGYQYVDAPEPNRTKLGSRKQVYEKLYVNQFLVSCRIWHLAFPCPVWM